MYSKHYTSLYKSIRRRGHDSKFYSPIMESDEYLRVGVCDTDEYSYICDTLPESWLLALNIGSSIYKYRLR